MSALFGLIAAVLLVVLAGTALAGALVLAVSHQ
jgi:hypothetical protein